jgi:3-hydroxyacyl-CoA dehydrogenase
MANEHVLVVGAGQMGAGIAQVALTAGLRVTLVDMAKDAVEKGAGRIRSGLGKLREKGKLDEGASAPRWAGSPPRPPPRGKMSTSPSRPPPRTRS